MNFDRNIAAILLVPLIGLAVPVAVFFWKMPQSALTPTEVELLKFSSQPLVVSHPGAAPPYSGAESPIHPPQPKPVIQTPAAAFPPGSIPAAGGTKPSDARTHPLQPLYLSMIYKDSGSKMAIIDGHVLHEGSVIAGHTILKIDSTRVLARTAGKEIWLSIE